MVISAAGNNGCAGKALKRGWRHTHSVHNRRYAAANGKH